MNALRRDAFPEDGVFACLINGFIMAGIWRDLDRVRRERYFPAAAVFLASARFRCEGNGTGDPLSRGVT
jgi:hypothetical protein